MDAIKTHELFEGVDDNSRKADRKQLKLMNNSGKVLGYVLHSSFFQFLRNKFPSFTELSRKQMEALVEKGQILRVCEQQSMALSFNQYTVCIVIYGQVQVESKKYTTDKFFVVGEERMDFFFRSKSLIVMLHKESLQSQMHKFQDRHFKKQLLKKLWPIDLVRLSKGQIQKIADNLQFANSFSGEKIVSKKGSKKGLFLLYQGVFSIIGNEQIKIAEIKGDYFGQQILWLNEYQFELMTESVGGCYAFINQQQLSKLLTPINIKLMKQGYNKRLQMRTTLQNSLSENLNYTRDFLKKLNKSRKQSAISKMDMKEPIRYILKRNLHRKDLYFQNTAVSKAIEDNSVSKIANQSSLFDGFASSIQEKTQSFFDDNAIKEQSMYTPFEPKIYKNQRAKTQHLFRKRSKSPVSDANYTIKQSQPYLQNAYKDIEKVRNLPKTLSVLLRHYQNTQRLKVRSKTVVVCSGGFAPTSKQRRTMTTMKLHKQIFMKQYFQIKTIEDKAFKTWR